MPPPPRLGMHRAARAARARRCEATPGLGTLRGERVRELRRREAPSVLCAAPHLCSSLQAADFRGRVVLDARLPRREGAKGGCGTGAEPTLCGVGAAATLTLSRTRCCAVSFSTRCCAFTEPVSQPQIWASRSFAVRWCLATTVGAATQARRSTRHRTMPRARTSVLVSTSRCCSRQRRPIRRKRGE